MYECLLHILAFMGLSFSTFERLDQEFITFERLPAQAAFTISNLQSKIAFRISLLLLLGIYYIWADAWARPVVTKFMIANGISQMHFYKSEYLRQKASNPNILKKKNKQRFWHWEPTKWQLGFRASFWVVELNLNFFGNDFFKCLRINFLKFLIIFFNFENYFLNFYLATCWVIVKLPSWKSFLKFWKSFLKFWNLVLKFWASISLGGCEVFKLKMKIENIEEKNKINWMNILSQHLSGLLWSCQAEKCKGKLFQITSEWRVLQQHCEGLS